MRRTRSVVTLFCIVLIIFLQSDIAISIDIPADLQHGPYVDTVIYKVFQGYEERVLALQSGDIDLDTSFVKLSDLPSLNEDSDIDIFESPRNGYGHITINCARYPFNISGFRRAFAFAFNKTKVLYDLLDGHGSLLDSIVPSVSRWCAEDLFDCHYYDAEPEIGNAILDELGFAIDGTTGFREAPNGDALSVTVLYLSSWPIPFIDGSEIASVAVEALSSLNISATQERVNILYEPYYFPPYNNDFDMIFYESGFQYDNLDWLVTRYGSEYADADEPGYSENSNNMPNFSNETFDSWIYQLTNGKTYEEIYEASTKMQKILHYNVPQLVVYQNNILQGYRNDQFEGHVEDLERHISGLWTLRKVHRIDGTHGGTINVALWQYPDSFNIFAWPSPYSNMILENLYSSLYSRDPNMNPIPDLVESMIVETHSNNSNVSSNHTRFTFDIIQNATWSDGEPLTAEDIAFTFIYAQMIGDYENPAAAGLGDLVDAYAPNPYRAVIEFSTESYWHFSNIAYDYIIPEHIFNKTGVPSYSEWATWNPGFNPEDPFVTSGPLVFREMEFGEFYELSINADYHWNPNIIPSSPTLTDNETTPPPFPLQDFIVVFSVSGVVTIVIGTLIIKKRFDVNLF